MRNKLLPCTGNGYIQLSVYSTVVIQVTEKIHLMGFVNAKRQDDYVALTALESFYSVDHYFSASCKPDSVSLCLINAI